jgi:peptidoglycan/xylan/chitin deacetylase (PgdA/CDA1 family)
VALTFDSGWIWDTATPMLDVLKSYGLRVTFFPRGKWIEDHPELVRRMIAEGHEIGSHSYTHPDLTKQTPEKIDSEIALAKQALIGVAGGQAFVPLYRPPYGSHNTAITQVLAAYGYGWVVMWQVDSLDWKPDMSTQAIIDRVLGRVEDGGIVLMHIGRKETVEAMPAIIDGLLAKGYSIVRVTDLLDIRHDGGPETKPYVVLKGDTLADLARRFDTTVEKLVELNPQLIK